jgi:hypothetical protein
MTSQTIIYLFGLADRIFAIVLKVIKINQERLLLLALSCFILVLTLTMMVKIKILTI